MNVLQNFDEIYYRTLAKNWLVKRNKKSLDELRQYLDSIGAKLGRKKFEYVFYDPRTWLYRDYIVTKINGKDEISKWIVNEDLWNKIHNKHSDNVEYYKLNFIKPVVKPMIKLEGKKNVTKTKSKVERFA